jgi:hypothetical protein
VIAHDRYHNHDLPELHDFPELHDLPELGDLVRQLCCLHLLRDALRGLIQEINLARRAGLATINAGVVEVLTDSARRAPVWRRNQVNGAGDHAG